MLSGASVRNDWPYWALCCVCGSFFLQPLNIRPMGVPVSLVLMVGLAFFLALRRPAADVGEVIAFFPVFAILFVHDFLIEEQIRSLIFMLLILCVRFLRVDLDFFRVGKVFDLLGYVCLLLTFVGIYRYHLGYDVQGSENVGGIGEGVVKYFYMGISYLPSTRNSDVIYFAVAYLVFLSRAANAPRASKLDPIFCLVALYAVLMSLSRGAWLSVLVASVVALGFKRFWSIFLPIVTFASLFISVFYPEVLQLFLAGVLSLVSSGAANELVTGFYKYSNDDRLYIYVRSLQDFMNQPFGHGVSFVPSYAHLTGAKSVHSENIYLDFLLALGVFSLPLFWAIFRWFSRLGFVPDSHLKRLVFSLAVFLLFFHLFNSGMDFVFGWFLVVLLVIAAPAIRTLRTPAGPGECEPQS